jgi:hypothetical protein
MPSFISKKLAFNNAEQFIESFYEPEPTTVGYVFIGNHIPYTDEESPDSITDTLFESKSVWDNMYAAKKITGSEVELVLPRVYWSGNTKYRQFDDVVTLSELLTSNTSQNLKPIYSINSENNVYKCLSNSASANSTVEPTGQNLTANGIVATSDGYIWKYLYNIKPSNRFLSDIWIPAPVSITKLDYSSSNVTVVDGELTTISVSNSGSGYIHSTITVTSFSSGCTILTVANTDNLVSNLSISGTGIPALAHIESVDSGNSKITLSNSTAGSGGGSGNNLTVLTRIKIDGDGSDAVASAVLSNNTISKITLTNYGKNYSRANVIIYGTGTNATARAILPPKYGHGYNSAKELGATNVMISMKIGEVDSSETGIISTDTSFRQYGFLRDPHKYGILTSANTATANAVISQTTDVTLVAGSDYVLDEFVFQGPDAGSSTFSGFVHAQTLTEVRLTRVRGTILNGVPLKGTVSNPTGRTVITKINPEFEPYSGDILFVENVIKTERTDGQAENLKFVIQF